MQDDGNNPAKSINMIFVAIDVDSKTMEALKVSFQYPNAVLWCVAEESFLPLEFPVQTNTDRSF